MASLMPNSAIENNDAWTLYQPKSTFTIDNPIFTPNIFTIWANRTSVKIQVWAQCLSQTTPKTAIDVHNWICVTKDGLGKSFYFAYTEARYQAGPITVTKVTLLSGPAFLKDSVQGIKQALANEL